MAALWVLDPRNCRKGWEKIDTAVNIRGLAFYQDRVWAVSRTIDYDSGGGGTTRGGGSGGGRGGANPPDELREAPGTQSVCYFTPFHNRVQVHLFVENKYVGGEESLSLHFG